MGRWDEAINACGRAMALTWDFDLAKNSLARAQKMRAVRPQ